jgi:hypothetical protein
MSLNDIDMSGVEEPKDFGAVKACATRIRIKSIERITEGLEAKDYDEYYLVKTEFVDPTTVEPVDPTTVPSAPITRLYTHNKGCLQMLRRFIESHGFGWDEFVGSTDREGFLQGLVGAEADVKITLGKTTTGNDRNEIRYPAKAKVA